MLSAISRLCCSFSESPAWLIAPERGRSSRIEGRARVRKTRPRRRPPFRSTVSRRPVSLGSHLFQSMDGTNYKHHRATRSRSLPFARRAERATRCARGRNDAAARRAAGRRRGWLTLPRPGQFLSGYMETNERPAINRC